MGDLLENYPLMFFIGIIIGLVYCGLKLLWCCISGQPYSTKNPLNIFAILVGIVYGFMGDE